MRLSNTVVDKGLLLVTSDLHYVEAIKLLSGYARELAEEIPIQLLLVGDKVANPLGPNHLREAKKRAKTQGIDHVAAEQQLWDDPQFQPLLVDQWRGIYEPTRLIQFSLESLLSDGVLTSTKIFDTGGNDEDRLRRSDIAERLYASTTEKPVRVPLRDVVAHSPFFDHKENVTIIRYGSALYITIPYIEDKTPEQLVGYQQKIQRALNSRLLRGVEQVALFSHTNPDKRLRTEKHNDWYLQIYEVLQAKLSYVFGSGTIMHVSGHTQYTPPPYEFEGVHQVPIGFGDSRQEITSGLQILYSGTDQKHIQRVLTLNPADPRNYKSHDFPLTREKEV